MPISSIAGILLLCCASLSAQPAHPLLGCWHGIDEPADIRCFETNRLIHANSGEELLVLPVARYGTDTVVVPDLGQALAEDCANCHGSDGNPTGANMPTLAGQDARYFIKAMQAYKNGKRQHQQMFDAVDSLGEQEVIDLAAFYAAQEPVRRNVRAPLTTGEWIDRCERCHGIAGNSTDPRFPMLAGQDRTYLVNALQSYNGASRSNSTMHAMSAPLSGADIDAIASYYSTREPKSVIYMQFPCENPADE